MTKDNKKSISYKAQSTQQFVEEDVVVIGNDGSAVLPGINAVAVPSTKNMFNEPDQDPKEVDLSGKKYKIINWGEDNDLPNQILEKIGRCEVLSAGLYFNAFTGYGQGLIPCYYEFDSQGNGTVKHYYYKGIELKKQLRDLKMQKLELEDKDDDLSSKKLEIVNEDITEMDEKKKRWDQTMVELKEFFSYNDTNHFIDELLIDLNFFFMGVPMLVLNEKKKVVSVKHREAAFSRWTEKNKKGKVENMIYSWRWHETSQIGKEDAIPYAVLDPDSPLRDLKEQLGMISNGAGTKKDTNTRKFIVPLPLPSPGRFYYPKSPWYATFLSGWYDIWSKIPEGKNSIFDNIMALGYHIELSDDYFEGIFEEEGINTDEGKKARIKKEYSKLNDFLSGKDNMGKSVVSFVTFDNEGKEKRKMKITAIDNPYKDGGQYIEDSEEASNMMSQAMWVHPSIIGASPGKNKSINGTEARELFIMKNAMQKPFRDRAVKPFYLAKEINGWDPELEWMIPNIELTTLDENKGSKKVIS